MIFFNAEVVVLRKFCFRGICVCERLDHVQLGFNRDVSCLLILLYLGDVYFSIILCSSSTPVSFLLVL